jgi:hypothetical protein
MTLFGNVFITINLISGYFKLSSHEEYDSTGTRFIPVFSLFCNYNDLMVLTENNHHMVLQINELMTKDQR